MSLSNSIDPRVWEAVQTTYEAGNYSGAILDSVHYLSELIRDKSGLDSDGNQLVGAAFGGQNPIVKVNLLQSESERDEQRGVEQLLRGVYTAIRNPRSHEKRSDAIETADVLIGFINYLAGLIDQSKSPFDIKQIVDRVFDQHFAQTEKYADLLVARIPERKRLETIIQVFNRRGEGNWRSIALFIESALKAMSADEGKIFWQVVSESLENACADADFRSAIQIAGEHWLEISEIARLRTEHRLIQSIAEGEYDQQKRSCPKGSLGTWARDLVQRFILQDELIDAIASRIGSLNPRARAYAMNYFWSTLRHWKPVPPMRSSGRWSKG